MDQSRRFLPLLLTAASALALLVPTTLAVDTAEAAPAAGYTASFIPLGAGTSFAASVAVNPDTGVLYVGEVTTTGYQLVVMDESSRTIKATIELASEPLSIAVNSHTNTVYVSSGGSVIVIDGTTNTVTATIKVPGGSASGAIAVNSATNLIYSVIGTGLNGSVVVIDGSTNTVLTTVSSGGGTPYDIAVDESTDVVWVANFRGTVVAISGASPYATIHSVSVTDPLRVAVNPDTDDVYVASSGLESNPVTVINGTSYTTTTLPVTDAAFGHIVVDPSADVVFVTAQSNLGSGTVVIGGTTNTVADVIAPGGDVAAVDTSTGTEYETSDSSEPPGLWAVSPSASNAISPVMTGPATAATSTGAFFSASFNATGLPTPTIAETGPLPAGVTFDPSSGGGTLSGIPAAGTAGVYPIMVTASNGVAPDFSLSFTLTVTAPAGSSYVTAGPVRVLDTRNGTGTGGVIAPVGSGELLSLQVDGVDGVPTTGVSAVVLNVTVTDTTKAGYLAVCPDGQACNAQSSSNLNWTAGETIPNLVTVPVGADGKVDFFNAAGNTDIVADLEGYYSTASGGSSYFPAGPVRVLDTRNGTGGFTTPVGPGKAIALQVDGTAGVPASGVSAVVLNVTVTDTSRAAYLAVCPDGQTCNAQSSSNLNWLAGETIPNLVTVPVGTDGKVDFFNAAGNTDIVADLEGYYAAASGGSQYFPAGPVRILDTRNGTGGFTTPVGAGKAIALQVDSRAGVPATGVTAVVINTTVTDTTAGAYLAVCPDGQTCNAQSSSNLNWTPGETIPNLVVVPVGTDGAVDFFNAAGNTDIIADLEGYFANP